MTRRRIQVWGRNSGISEDVTGDKEQTLAPSTQLIRHQSAAHSTRTEQAQAGCHGNNEGT